MRHRPPRWAERLLERALPHEESEAVVGDLAEEFERRVAREGRGAARRWFTYEALRLAARFVWERGAEGRRHTATARPIPSGGDAHTRGGMGMEGFTRDVATTVRVLLRKPAFLAVTTLTLALGVGANTAIFSVLQRALLAPLPYPEPDDVVWVSDKRIGGWAGNSSTILNLVDVQERTRALQQLAVYQSTTINLSGDGSAERASAYRVSPEFFGVLGLAPRPGRDFTSPENIEGATPVVVIGHGLWQRRYGGDAAAVGRTLMVNSEPHTIIGVAAPDLRLPGRPDLFVPFRWDVGSLNRGNRAVYSIGRLRPTTTLDEANDELATLFAELRTEHPGPNEGWSMEAVRLQDSLVGDANRRLLFVLAGAAGMVLLIACVNVANLLLARAETRGREMAVRAALGAGRGRVVSLFLAEGLTLALIGGLGGVVLAALGVPLLQRYLVRGLPGAEEPALSLPVLGFTLAVAVLAGLLTGLGPALTTRLRDVHGGLREGGRGSTGRGSALRRTLVVVQISLAVTLVAGAGLLLRSFWAVSSIELGLHEPEQVVAFNVSLPSSVYPDATTVGGFFRDFTDRIAQLPGVVGATVSNRLPLSAGTNVTEVNLVGDPDRTADFMELRTVTPAFFTTAGIEIVRGRGLQVGDALTEPGQVVVSQTLARELTPDGGEIVGRQIAVWDGFEPVVVGVAADTRDRGPTREPPPSMYFDLGGPFQPATEAILVRTEGSPLEVIPEVRAILGSMNPTLAMSDTRLLSDQVRDVVGRGRTSLLRTILLFGVLALALGGIGIYGVMAWFVAQRRREMGVRIALGAGRNAVAGLVLRQGIQMTGIGVLLGVVGALASTRLMESLLYEVTPTDPLTHGAVALLLASVAAFATWIPARRAARVDPVEAFRSE